MYEFCRTLSSMAEDEAQQNQLPHEEDDSSEVTGVEQSPVRNSDDTSNDTSKENRSNYDYGCQVCHVITSTYYEKLRIYYSFHIIVIGWYVLF